ncbi:MAG: tetraacyldisaccharide 4'-kinase [Gammaproteobacteria bacterium]|nr:tetraacyldisaccharide 4'-kinase [Gammaproteobacteria bacterium]
MVFPGCQAGRKVKPIEHYWESINPVSLLLLPFSWVFCAAGSMRRRAFGAGLLKASRLPVPVIVVGNITVGGTGKTPLVIKLVEALRDAGYRPGVVSRGYGGKSAAWPRDVFPDSSPEQVGDEPVLIARRTGSPVCVGPNRPIAARRLLDSWNCDIIVCDDGMQHYALERDIEIAVVDGKRRFSNGFCLPAGPLRETPSRLKRVDLIVNNGCEAPGEMRMAIGAVDLVNLADGNNTRPINSMAGMQVHAVAGIGNPTRFFETLRAAGIEPVEHVFPDHHQYSSQNLSYGDHLPLVMTEKDAVKCEPFAHSDHWYLRVGAELDDSFTERVLNLLEEY